MQINWNRTLAILLPSLMSIVGFGCQTTGGSPPSPPLMLGSDIDLINQTQEENAEAAKYVVHMHEFELNDPEQANSSGYRLNSYGEDHLKQIAANVRTGSPYPVVVERGNSSSKPGTVYNYPVHFNDSLDLQRRTVVVAALNALGVHNADDLVVVAPSAAEGITGAEASSAYQRGLNGGGRGFGGFGSGFGGSGIGGGGIY